MYKAGFTLLEVLIVLIIVGILAALGLPGFTKAREMALDKEAIASLKLIRAAERIYRMEVGDYCRSAACSGNETLINQYLKLFLPTTNKRWNYKVDPAGTPSYFNAKAQRTTLPRPGGLSYNTWCITYNLDEPCNNTTCGWCSW
ncbi:MAG: type II secretion system GspH family protein [Candidatus Omnitrophica bacterium]|nr:type II secretion system GspH family protein [Candidatus Omnitrophota bacterium]